MGDFSDQVASLQREWAADRRWTEIRRAHGAGDVVRLRGSAAADHGLARHGARRLWELLGRGDAVRALSATNGDHAAEMVEAGLQAIYLPGRPTASDGSLAGQAHPAPLPCPASPVPQAVRRINDAMLLADAGGTARRQRRLAPVVVDADAGFGSPSDAFELMTAMIEAGAAGVLFEDRLTPGNERGQLGGKVLVPTGQHIETLNAARLAADVLNVPSLVIARTCAHETSLLTSDVDEQDHEFLTGERTADGLHVVQPGRYARVTRALAFAPYADLLWLETSTPSLTEARTFATVIHSQYPDQLLAYSCSPGFDWAHLDDASVARFHSELAAMGYRFQFIPQGAVRPPDVSTSTPAQRYARDDMPASV